jgi:hypothetical protein
MDNKKTDQAILLIIIAGCLLFTIALFTPAHKGKSATYPSQNYLPFAAKSYPLPTGTPGPGRLLIAEVLYDPIGTDPDGEWVELFNPGQNPVDLSIYKIGDEETPGGNEGLYQFPPATFILPRQSIVIASRASTFKNTYGLLPDYEFSESDPFVPNLIEYAAWATGKVSLSNTGDEVVILDATDQLLDTVSWGASTLGLDPPVPKVAEGHSLERSPAYQDTDSKEDWVDQPFPILWKVDLNGPTPIPSFTPEPSATPTPAGPVQLSISEVYYNPLNVAEPAGEWIEIYNSGDYTASLGAYKIGDEETNGQGEGMMQFPADALLIPGGVAVIANQALVFSNTYGFDPDFEMFDSDPSVPQMIHYRAWAGGSINLSDGGDEVIILDTNNQIMDAISWGNSKWAFDPSIPLVIEGHSLERNPANKDTNSATDWVDQPMPEPGKIGLSTVERSRQTSVNHGQRPSANNNGLCLVFPIAAPSGCQTAHFADYHDDFALDFYRAGVINYIGFIGRICRL